MTRIHKVIIAVIIVLFCGLFLSAYTVSEGQRAFVLRLGQILNDSKTGTPAILTPGLHFKVPFLDRIHIFDARLQEFATPSSQPLMVVTKEQTYLLVDYFAKWRISQLAKFYTSTGGSISWAETLLEQRLNDIIRAEYGKYTSNQAISVNRASMMASIREEANQIGKDQGITVLDVRIQQITLPKDVMDSVFNRMAVERKQFAEAKRAEGVEKAEGIRALADQKVTVIKAEALMQGASVRAKGDQIAAEIFSKAYNTDPKFYAYFRSLEAYRQSFNQKSDLLVLKPEGQFFNYFHNAGNNGNNDNNKKK